MAFPDYPATSFEQAVDLAIFSSNQLGGIINGDATEEVATLNGPIPTVRKAYTDNFFFKSPIDWASNQSETVFNQLRFFSNGVLSAYYYAPKATTNTPVKMLTTPVGDSNWVLYSVQQQQVASDVYPWLYETATGEETVISPPYVFDTAIVTINGVVQIPNQAYTIENSQIILKEPLGVDPVSGLPNLLFAYLGKIESGASDYIQATVLASNIGSSMIGELGSCPALRTLLPTKTNQKVVVKGYNNGSSLGGGKFYYISDSVSVDDGGTFFRVNSSGGWSRAKEELATLDVTHFGATMDGVTDDTAAVKRMHDYSYKQHPTYNRGIVLPAGKICIDVIDTGSAEISSFKLRGPEVSYGRIPAVRIIPFSKTQTKAMFTTVARYCEIANVIFWGAKDNIYQDQKYVIDTVQPYFVNNVVAGAYCRFSNIRARATGGRVLDVFDTIDTLLDQCYSSGGNASFFRARWSNTTKGVWDHSTAIEIKNSNFEGHTGDQYAIDVIRATQSSMHNVWFDKNNKAFDISQGDWTLSLVTQENSALPSAAQYTKLIITQERFANGQGISYTDSGYTQAMDTVDGVYKGIPSWVNSVYESGKVRTTNKGILIDGSLSYGYATSPYKLKNPGATSQWFEIGNIGFTETGQSAVLDLVGAGHYDNASGDISPGGTSFGGGRSKIFIQNKGDATKNSVTWYSEGASPILDVAYIQTSASRQRIFVLMRDYTPSVSVFIDTSDKSYYDSGLHFFFEPVMALSSAVTTTTPRALARWAVNNGTNGFAFDMNTGKLAIKGERTILGGVPYLPVTVNGNTNYISSQDSGGSIRMPVYNFAELPNVATHVYGLVLCRDTKMVPALQPIFSNGSNWYLLSDPSNKTWYPTT
jgi:hypothetical protein